ncbi:MAG: hybrid sensor histidine kinase/response regulator [bacterium]
MDIHSEAAAPATVPSLKGTVLVIDDERGPRESLRILLKPEFRVLCADSVDVGLAMLKAEQPDTIISDIRMPGKSGIEGLRAIRAIDPVVSVIMFTGFGALETAQEAIRLGANDYMKKPFDAFEILEVIRKHVQQTQLARRRRHAEEEVRELNLRLTEEMEKKNHLVSLGQKSAELVHDLRNPLATVLGYVELLALDLQKKNGSSETANQNTAEYLEHIEHSVLRCRDITDMWLDISRGRLNKGRIVVGDLVVAVVDECRYLAKQKGVELHLNDSTDAVTIDADSRQIARAIQNLVMNAVEAVKPQEGKVKVWCRTANDAVELVVQDNGSGMSPDILKRVFEPFFTTKSVTGTGLGLFITRQVVEGHGGSIQIESEAGRGTKITLVLPRMRLAS